MRKFIFIFFAFFISTAASLAAECTAETTQDKCTCAGWGWEPTTETCIQCSDNTHAAEGAGTCTECPEGFTAIKNGTICSLTCNAGQFYDKDTRSCKECSGENTFSQGFSVNPDSESTTCTPCPSYSTPNETHTQCNCEDGYYADGKTYTTNQTIPCTKTSCKPGEYPVNGQCKPCPEGSYCSGGIKETPETCPDHFTSDSGATSKSGCYMKTDTKFCDDSDCYQYSDIFGTGKINYPG